MNLLFDRFDESTSAITKLRYISSWKKILDVLEVSYFAKLNGQGSVTVRSDLHFLMVDEELYLWGDTPFVFILRSSSIFGLSSFFGFSILFIHCLWTFSIEAINFDLFLFLGCLLNCPLFAVKKSTATTSTNWTEPCREAIWYHQI